jgi:hypothetical protein
MQESQYYLAVIRPENLEALAAAGLRYYAVKGERTPIRLADRIALYRSRGAPSRGALESLVLSRSQASQCRSGVLVIQQCY